MQVDLAQLFTDGWFPRRDLFDIAHHRHRDAHRGRHRRWWWRPRWAWAPRSISSEYASPRTRRILKPILEILAGIPSVVLGFFALTVISPTLIDPICPGATPLFNMAAAGIAVGILITPLIASVAEDAMHAVPDSLREASYGLGARSAATSMRVVFPAAVSGIVAALILGLSRAIGETMIVAIAAGATGGSLFSVNPLPAGADDDRGHDRAGHRVRPGPRRQPRVPEPLLRRPPAVRHDARAQPRQRAFVRRVRKRY